MLLPCPQPMKDLMGASSALMIIVIDWDGWNKINPVRLFMQCSLTGKNVFAPVRQSERKEEIRAPICHDNNKRENRSKCGCGGNNQHL